MNWFRKLNREHPTRNKPKIKTIKPAEIHIYNKKDITDEDVKQIIRKELKKLDMVIPFTVKFEECNIEEEFRSRNWAWTYADGTLPTFRIEHYHLKKWTISINKIKIEIKERYPYILHREYDENGTELTPVQEIKFMLVYDYIIHHNIMVDILLATKKKLSEKAKRYLYIDANVKILKDYCSICKKITYHVSAGYTCTFCVRGSITIHECIQCMKKRS